MRNAIAASLVALLLSLVSACDTGPDLEDVDAAQTDVESYCHLAALESCVESSHDNPDLCGNMDWCVSQNEMWCIATLSETP